MTIAQPTYPTQEEITRNRLMDGCLQCIQQVGLAKTSIRHIADASGIARQTVYNYFKNKNEVVAATFEREGLQFAEDVADAIKSHDSVEEKFIAGFIYVVENFEKNPILAQITAPGSSFLSTVGMSHYPFAPFGQMVFREVFEQHPQLNSESEEISELWTRNALSFLSMPGRQRKSREELESYVRRRLIPGLHLQEI